MAERIILEGQHAIVTGGDGADTKANISSFVGALQQASIQGLDQEALADHLKWRVTSGSFSSWFPSSQQGVSPSRQSASDRAGWRTLADPWQ